MRFKNPSVNVRPGDEPLKAPSPCIFSPPYLSPNLKPHHSCHLAHQCPASTPCCFPFLFLQDAQRITVNGGYHLTSHFQTLPTSDSAVHKGKEKVLQKKMDSSCSETCLGYHWINFHMKIKILSLFFLLISHPSSVQ